MTWMSIRFAVGLAFAIVGSPVTAGELFRCVSDDGGVSWQDAPCAAGSRLSRAVPILVEPTPEPKKTAKRTGAKSVSAPLQRPAASRSTRASPGTRAQRRIACDAARKQHAAAIERLGLKRTFDQLRALEDQVQEVCKGL